MSQRNGMPSTTRMNVPGAPVSSDRIDSRAAVLSAVRANRDLTQPLLTQLAGLKRSVVAARVAELESAGLVAHAGLAPSTGGRAPAACGCAPAGLVVGIGIGATGMQVGLADLAGDVVAHADDAISVADGPEAVLGRAEQLIDDLRRRPEAQGPLWGVGVGVPGRVEFSSGLPVAPRTPGTTVGRGRREPAAGALVVPGGGVVNAGDHVLAAIREAVYRRSLPLATRTLRIEPSSLGRTGELVGAVHLALDELFEPARLARWLPHGSPAGQPELAPGDEAGSAA